MEQQGMESYLKKFYKRANISTEFLETDPCFGRMEEASISDGGTASG
jgi:hypothetical protein